MNKAFKSCYKSDITKTVQDACHCVLKMFDIISNNVLSYYYMYHALSTAKQLIDIQDN